MFKDNTAIKNTIMMLLIYACTQFIIMSIYAIFNGNIREDIEKSIYVLTAISGIVFLFVYYLTSVNMEASILQRVKFKYIERKNILRIILLAISISTFFWSISKLIYCLNGKVNCNYIFGMYSNNILSIISIIIFIPIIEELIFRGFLFYELEGKLNIEALCILQALIFSVMHSGLDYIIFNFVLGLILGAIYHWTKSLHGNILFYILYEFMGIVVLPNITFNVISIIICTIFTMILSVVLTSILYKNLRERLIKDSAWRAYS